MQNFLLGALAREHDSFRSYCKERYMFEWQLARFHSNMVFHFLFYIFDYGFIKRYFNIPISNAILLGGISRNFYIMAIFE